MTPQELKHRQVNIYKLNTAIADTKKEIAAIQRDIEFNKLNSTQEVVTQLLSNLKVKQQDLGKLFGLVRENTEKLEAKVNDGEPVISEHALLRYIQRIKGLDLNAVRDEMLTDFDKEVIKVYRNCELKKNDLVLVVVNNVVVTVKDR